MSATNRVDLGEYLEDFPCDFCGCRTEEFLFTKLGTVTQYPFAVVRCRTCGLIYLNPRLNEQAIAGLYGQEYYTGAGFDPTLDYVCESEDCSSCAAIRQSQKDTMDAVTALVSLPARLLDFGCGLGTLMRLAANQGYAVDGFELSPFAAEFVRSLGFQVYADLQDLPVDCYDCVIAIEVLEHCHSPTKVLNAIYRSLKPGGYFYYTTGNFDDFYLKWRLGIKDEGMTQMDAYILPEGHIHFFSTRVLKSYFRKAGFSRVFSGMPAYEKRGRLYQALATVGLAHRTSAVPVTSLQRLVYYGVRDAATFLGLRKRSLPLAAK